MGGPKKSNPVQDPSSVPFFSKNQPRENFYYNHNGKNNYLYQNENNALPPPNYLNRPENHNFNQIDEFQNNTMYFKNSNYAKISESVPKTKNISVIGTY